MKIESDFVILDVKEGHHDLYNIIESGEELYVNITIRLDTVHSRYDGVSQGFSGDVTYLEIL